MPSFRAGTRRAVPTATGMMIGLMLACSPASAEPPIRSPEDALCRLEARAKVFSTPNPQGLELEQIGRQIYFACMSRLEAKPAKRASRRRVHRHRRH